MKVAFVINVFPQTVEHAWARGLIDHLGSSYLTMSTEADFHVIDRRPVPSIYTG